MLLNDGLDRSPPLASTHILEDRCFAGKLVFAPGASEESISDFVREMNDEWRTK